MVLQREVKKEKAVYPSRDKRLITSPVVLTEFDPNTADSLLFAQLGFPGWMIGNIKNYRAKGGRFKQPEDFAKIYGLSDEQFATLLPYISIRQTETSHVDSLQLLIRSEKRDTFPKIEKLAKGTIIELNRADTTQLKMIPGIGSAIARMTVIRNDCKSGVWGMAGG